MKIGPKFGLSFLNFSHDLRGYERSCLQFQKVEQRFYLKTITEGLVPHRKCAKSGHLHSANRYLPVLKRHLPPWITHEVHSFETIAAQIHKLQHLFYDLTEKIVKVHCVVQENGWENHFFQTLCFFKKGSKMTCIWPISLQIFTITQNYLQILKVQTKSYPEMFLFLNVHYKIMSKSKTKKYPLTSKAGSFEPKNDISLVKLSRDRLINFLTHAHF